MIEGKRSEVIDHEAQRGAIVQIEFAISIDIGAEGK
jgi:hypothetical protein